MSAGEPPRLSRLGRYELITRIGQGGMAEVQLALQRGPGGFEKLVVVKLVHQNLATQKQFVDMLLDEARVAALLKHPNVVDIYDLGEADGRYFIAMEYLEGEPLLAVLSAGRDGKRLDPMSTARLIADTAEGLDAAHELRLLNGTSVELVHHDVSLGNIVVLYNGQVKLVDFGVAKASQAGTTTQIRGKFSYMAPEKLRGAGGDRRSDIWSLGCVLWESLTLRRLFKGSSDQDTRRKVLEQPIVPPSSVNSDVLPDFDPIVMRALERDPDHRYATAKEVALDLEEVLRQWGYGGRNELIAKYMQKTFAAHISARKRLLQEVSSHGRASEDVLSAAFDPAAPMQPTNTPGMSVAPEGTPHEGRPFKRTTNSMVAQMAEGTPVYTPNEPSTPGSRLARDTATPVTPLRTARDSSSPFLIKRDSRTLRAQMPPVELPADPNEPIDIGDIADADDPPPTSLRPSQAMPAVTPPSERPSQRTMSTVGLDAVTPPPEPIAPRRTNTHTIPPRNVPITTPPRSNATPVEPLPVVSPSERMRAASSQPPPSGKLVAPGRPLAELLNDPELGLDAHLEPEAKREISLVRNDRLHHDINATLDRIIEPPSSPKLQPTMRSNRPSAANIEGIALVKKPTRWPLIFLVVLLALGGAAFAYLTFLT